MLGTNHTLCKIEIYPCAPYSGRFQCRIRNEITIPCLPLTVRYLAVIPKALVSVVHWASGTAPPNLWSKVKTMILHRSSVRSITEAMRYWLPGNKHSDVIWKWTGNDHSWWPGRKFGWTLCHVLSKDMAWVTILSASSAESFFMDQPALDSSGGRGRQDPIRRSHRFQMTGSWLRIKYSLLV